MLAGRAGMVGVQRAFGIGVEGHNRRWRLGTKPLPRATPRSTDANSEGSTFSVNRIVLAAPSPRAMSPLEVWYTGNRSLNPLMRLSSSRWPHNRMD